MRSLGWEAYLNMSVHFLKMKVYPINHNKDVALLSYVEL